jgi:hypothetical protein
MSKQVRITLAIGSVLTILGVIVWLASRKLTPNFNESWESRRLAGNRILL